MGFKVRVQSLNLLKQEQSECAALGQLLHVGGRCNNDNNNNTSRKNTNNNSMKNKIRITIM